MNVSFLDANIFIRYLTNDDSAKVDRVEKLLDLAARGKELFRVVDGCLVRMNEGSSLPRFRWR